MYDPRLEYAYCDARFGLFLKKVATTMLHGLPASIELESGDTMAIPEASIISYDPSTTTRISRYPLVQDPFEVYKCIG
jgi:hypothetical protein